MFKEDIKKIDFYLESFLPDKTLSEEKLLKSVKYSLFSGGKRLRPLILLEFSRLFGGKDEFSIPFACAIEMIHTYSLIHDDLPSMDNSDERRGKPSNHMVFGEATAILAGDALLTLAFEVVSSFETSSEEILKAINVLSQCAGLKGMVSGQSMDLEIQHTSNKFIEKINYNKTCKLIIAASKIGCILAKASEREIFIAENYAKNFGFAFQIADDINDFYEEKNINLVKKIGIENSKKLVSEFIFKSENFLNKLKKDSSRIKRFGETLKTKCKSF